MSAAASISSVYQEGIVDAGKEPAFLFLVAFLVSWAFIRTSAHLIRAEVSWWPGTARWGGQRHPTLLGVALLCVALSGALGGAAGHAQAAWQTQRLESKQRLTTAFSVAAGKGGFALAAWLVGRAGDDVPDASELTDQRRLKVRVREAGASRFSSAVRFGEAGVTWLEVGAGEQGEAVVAWQQGKEVRVRSRDRAGSWIDESVIGLPRALLLDLAVSRDGSAILLVRSGGSVYAVARPAGGRFGVPQLITSEESMWLTLAADVGTGLVAWGPGCHPGGPRRPMQVSLLSSAGLFGPPEAVEGSSCPTSGLEAAIDASGGGVLLIDGDLTRGTIRASFREPGDRFGRAEIVAGRRRAVRASGVGMSASGRATLVWQTQGNVRGFHPIEARSRPPRGSLGPRSRISRRGLLLNELAVAPSDAAVVLGQSRRSSRVKVIVRKPGRRFGRPEAISPRLPRKALAPSDVVINSTGLVTALWSVPRHRHADARGLFVASGR